MLSAIILVLVDMVLDPDAVVLSIWVWLIPGPHYSIPITNYTGWFLIAFIASIILYYSLQRISQVQMQIPIEVSSRAFWTGFSLWVGLHISLGIGLSMTMVIGYFLLKNSNV